MPDELMNLTAYYDYRIIKGLIKNKVSLLKVTNNNFYFNSGDNTECHEDLTDIYIDIDRFLKSASIKDNQRKIIQAYLKGYTGKDIEDLYGIPTTTSDRWLTTISKDIANTNRKKSES